MLGSSPLAVFLKGYRVLSLAVSLKSFGVLSLAVFSLFWTTPFLPQISHPLAAAAANAAEVTEILPQLSPPPLDAVACTILWRQQEQKQPGNLRCYLSAPAVHVHDSLTSSASRRTHLPPLPQLIALWARPRGVTGAS